MILVCVCGKTEEHSELPESLKSPQDVQSPEDWRTSPYCFDTGRKEDGTNPLLIHGVVRAFCSRKCEHETRDEYWQERLLKSA